MQVTGVIIDGLEIVGFQVMNAKGNMAKIQQEKAFDLARTGKLDGVTVQSVAGTEYLAGIDYSVLTHIPYSMIVGEIQNRDEQGNYNTEIDGASKNISPQQAWKQTAAGTLEGARAGLLAVRELGTGKQSIIKCFKIDNTD